MRFDDHDYTEIANKYDLSSIKSLHVYYDVYFIKKVLSGLVKSDEVCNLFIRRTLPYDLRQSNVLEQTFSSKNFVLNSASFKLKREWNSMPDEIKNMLKLSEFKSALKDKVLIYE